MLQIRHGVFETNSSSTHSICISKTHVDVPKGKKIYFTFGKYGWDDRTVGDTASYLYTGIYGDEGALTKLKSILDKWGVEYEFEQPRDSGWGYLEHGYVDHSEGLREFVFAVLSDEDLLARYLFGNACIYTGNDNEDNDPETFGQARSYYYDEECERRDNPYHDPEHFDYFFKGN